MKRPGHNHNNGRQSDDELSSISFGALNSARKQLAKEKRDAFFEQEDDDLSDDDAPPEESSSLDKKKRHKHAPTTASAKKRVTRVRPIHGLEINPKYNQLNLYQDIRFDTTYGKADMIQARKNYAFLDDYRREEISKMKEMLRNPDMLEIRDRSALEYKVQLLQSRLDTLSNKDRERQVLADHKKLQMTNYKLGNLNKPYFLKKSDKRKLLQVAKFELMSLRQREKVVERKRKRKLGQEMRQLEGEGFK